MLVGIAMARIATVEETSGFKKTMGKGKSVAMTEPIVGIKFRPNAAKPKNPAGSMPKKKKVKPTKRPVLADVINFVTI